MPPKRKRGSAAASRGRRGRPPKKNVPPTEVLPASDIIDSSSSSSTIIEEQSQPDNKIKLETKIHKKFGIKYHVPDEVVTLKSISPIENTASSKGSIQETPEAVSEVSETVCEASEESSSPVDEQFVEKMETETNSVAEIEENLVENEISEEFQQLEVYEEGSEIVENIDLNEVDLEGGVVLEYITTEQSEDEVILTTENEMIGSNDESAEEVYYVVEETDDTMMEDGVTTEILQPKIESDIEQHDEELTESIEPNMEEIQDATSTNLDEKEETKMNVVDEVKEEIINDTPTKFKDRKKEKDDNVKSSEKTPRKSTRISNRGSRKTLTPACSPVNSTESVIAPDTEEQQIKEEPIDIPMEKLVVKEEPLEEQFKEKDSNISQTEVQEVKTEIESNLNESIKAISITTKEPGKKVKKIKKTIVKPKILSKEVKVSTTKESKIKKEEKALTPKEEKPKKMNKKSNITPKDKPKLKKGKESKSLQQSKNELLKGDDDDLNIRRSSRIKTISTQKVRSKGKGLVKKDESTEQQISGQLADDKNVFVAPVCTPDGEHKPVKVKSRWRRSSELEMRDIVKSPVTDVIISDKEIEKKKNEVQEVERRLKQFLHLKENVYLTERISCKEAKKMICDCFLTEEEVQEGEYGCGDDCLNRLLMIECGNLCPVGDRCTNKRFQKMQSASVEAFCTEKKGLGIRAVNNIPRGDFILEYVGEVLDADKFEKRAAEYSKDKNTHYYFMSLRGDAIIDATMKGNISRFINHSCDPNAETQKWTVNGELRIGFFSRKTILAGEEITFDYQFQRYGKEAQKCFCEAPTCRGWLGEEPDSDDESEEEDDEEEEDEDAVSTPKTEDGPQVDKVQTKDDPKSTHKQKENVTVTPMVKKVVKKEKPAKKERKPREAKNRFKARIDRFEDLGLDEEIESLQTTGLKNQAHTLKLSRLMVRAKEPVQRTKLLKLLKKGEFPCRRLFLDYHGLRLIHGWMTDAQHLAKEDPNMENLRLDILQTLAVLPISNKTMLQDSKVLLAVEKWAHKDTQQSSGDSDSNSPKMDSEKTSNSDETKDKKDEKSPEDKNKDVVEVSNVTTDSVSGKPISETSEEVSANTDEETDDDIRKSTDDFVPLPLPVKVIKQKSPKPKYDILVEITELALKLLEEWSSLKEMFRIPKKERIEQMKEHEREADRRYKALSVEQETERKRDRYRCFQRPSRIETTTERKDRIKVDRYSATSKLNKYQRRELFARQAEEEERMRKQQLWAQQKNNWIMGHDPRVPPPYDPNRGVQCMWNPQIGQWQNVVTDPNVPGVLPIPHNMTNVPPVLPNILPGVPPNIPPPYNYPPFSRPNLPHVEVPHGIQPGMLPPNVVQPNMPPANMGAVLPMPNIPPRPALPYHGEEEDPTKVRFMGPIPLPVKLPPKWKCAHDKFGRPYYYHVKIRKAQWIPPEFPLEQANQEEEFETSSSSDTSSLSSSSDSDDSDSEDDTKLMLEIRKKFEQQKLAKLKKQEEENQQLLLNISANANTIIEDTNPALRDNIPLNENTMISSDIMIMTDMMDKSMAEEKSSPPEGQIAEFPPPPVKKRRIGLVQELIISPRTDEDRLQFREDAKKYKQNKEMVRKEKEVVYHKHHRKQSKSSTSTSDKEISRSHNKKKVSTKVKIREMEANTSSEESKKIKETFRAAMATVMVAILNPYRKADCKEGRIMGTEDFKHLARKLTHFVMLKELKHCDRIEDLQCTESVKGKAKEFVRKYMSKFGEVYQRPTEEVDTF